MQTRQECNPISTAGKRTRKLILVCLKQGSERYIVLLYGSSDGHRGSSWVYFSLTVNNVVSTDLTLPFCFADSASGNEQWHDLGFDAAQSFNSYSMKWSGWGIEWFVNERLVRTALRNESQDMPDPFYSPMRVVANIWPVDSKTIQWAGQVSDNFMFTKAEYAWIRFEAGETCQILSDCGF